VRQQHRCRENRAEVTLFQINGLERIEDEVELVPLAAFDARFQFSISDLDFSILSLFSKKKLCLYFTRATSWPRQQRAAQPRSSAATGAAADSDKHRLRLFKNKRVILQRAAKS
jgi:hypothetical protein